MKNFLIKAISEIVRDGKMSNDTARQSAENQKNLLSKGVNALGGIVVKVDGGQLGFNPSHRQTCIGQLPLKRVTATMTNVQLPVVDSGTATWADVEGTNETSNKMAVTLTPHRLTMVLDYSADVLLTIGEQVEQQFLNDMMGAMYQRIEATMFNTTANAQGIPATLLTNEYSSGITTANDLLAMEAQAGFIGSYIMHPTTFASLKAMEANGTPLGHDGAIFGRRVYETTSVTEGTIIYCDPSDILLTDFGYLDIVCDTVTKKINGVCSLVVNGYFDFKFQHAGTHIFAKINNE